jgi:hypothetical protein
VLVPIPDTNDPEGGFPQGREVVVVPPDLDICLAGLTWADDSPVDPLTITFVVIVIPPHLRGSTHKVVAEARFPKSSEVRVVGGLPAGQGVPASGCVTVVRECVPP